MTLLEFFYLSWATYYLATAFVDIVLVILVWEAKKWEEEKHLVDKSLKLRHLLKHLDRKPFNCVLCMAGYSSVILFALAQLISVAFIIIPAAAGVALLLSKIQQKLETFTID